MVFGEVIAVNVTKFINTICGENAELLIIKVGGACGHHHVSKELQQNSNRLMLTGWPTHLLSDT
jgi:hypothetical protein